MRIRLAPSLVALAVVAFACPVWAHAESAPITLTRPATIGSTSLHPGKYTLTPNADMNKVMVKRDGKLVATVPATQVTLHNKPAYTAVVLNGRQIQEIQFEGKTAAVKVD
ncbi:MAG TPA: hypothetical protein VMV59_10600 [Candidatus Dormibacteraeota bacterium]|nr:hypothetical protein [Candidatus Dormibacteraeota bacterium]